MNFAPCYAQFPPMYDIVRVESRIEQQFFIYETLMHIDEENYTVYGENDYKKVEKMITHSI